MARIPASAGQKPVDLPMPVESFPADDGQRVSPWAVAEGLAMRPITLG
ncbi:MULTISPECIES: hypothetical protein [Streptomyces]|nr:hypothetical protein [Streptomyces viridochromogenes]